MHTILLGTHRAWLALRAFVGPRGHPSPGKDTLRGTRIYPLAQADDPPETRHVEASVRPFDSIQAIGSRYFE